MGENTVKIEKEAVAADARKWRTFMAVAGPALKWAGKNVGIPGALVFAAVSGVNAIRDHDDDAPPQRTIDQMTALTKRVDELDNPATGAVASLHNEVSSVKTDVAAVKSDVAGVKEDTKAIKTALLGTEYDRSSGLVAKIAALEARFPK